MKRIFSTVAVTWLAAGVFGSEAAAQSATATATYEVQAINEISLSGNPGSLVISTAADLLGVSDNSTTWAVTTNTSGAKVTATLNSDMPPGVTLKVSLAQPTGATSAGAVALSSVAADLVTGISAVTGTGLAVTYTLSALPTAGVVPSGTRTVTFTITGGT